MHSRRAKVHDNLGNKSLISAQARRNLLIFGNTYAELLLSPKGESYVRMER